MAKVLDYSLKGSEFELRLRYYVYFRTKIFWKDMNHLFIQV